MTKRRTTPIPIDDTPDLLVKSKKQFETELDDRIQQGEDMLGKQTSTMQELWQLKNDYSSWHDFNSELIKRAFNRANNQFYKDYIYEPIGISFGSVFGPDTPSFTEMVGEARGDISQKLKRLKLIKGKLPLVDEVVGIETTVEKSFIDIQAEAIAQLARIFLRFHKVAQSLRYRHGDRETLVIKDEYDVQDLLHSLLQIYFDDVRAEDYSPSYAGANSRTDFVLKDEKIIVEVKMTNDHLRDKEVGAQLLIDIGRYRGYPDCKVLVIFVYDKGDHIRNKAGLINDLERMSTPTLEVKAYIYPR